MADVREVVVPDIGDFDDVPVIEVLVQPGDTVAPEDPLVTLESDKATMDVPAPFGGVVQELKVRVGDKVSEGTLLLTLEAEVNGAKPTAAKEPAPTEHAETAPAAEAGAPGAAETALRAEESAAGGGAPGRAQPAGRGGPPPP